MKKKRIMLHVVALALALACMACAALGVLKMKDVNEHITKEEAEESYSYHYIAGVEEVLNSIYEQLSCKELHGGENTAIEEVKIPSDELSPEFYYTIVKEGTNKKIATNYYEKERFRSNVCVFNQDGLQFNTSQFYQEDCVTERLNSFIEQGIFFYDNGAMDVPFEKFQRLCKKEKFHVEMYTRQQDDLETYFSDLRYNFKIDVTQKQKEAWVKEAVIYFIVAGILALMILIPYIWLIVIAGHRDKRDKPQLQRIDKLWMDVVLVAVVALYLIAILLVDDVMYDVVNAPDKIVFGIWIFITMFAIEAVLQMSESVARRLKTKNFIRTTMIGRICVAIKRALVKLVHNMKLSAKVIAMCIGLELILFLDFVVVSEMYDIFAALCIIAIPVVVIGVLVWNYFREQEIIIEETNKIAKGQVDNKIYDLMKFSSNKKLSKAVNRIGEGLSNAVSSSLKNERMKTELITNVSHDLKTPLTSIINYVDLLKTEGLDSEKASEYLEVLDRKSQRLKTLTEDLVEVSKLNSGVVKMNIENINIVQLVNQSLAEYSDRFEEKHLRIIENIRKDIMIVKADGKKTWRVLDNLYSNVCKYAMPDTRVYVDVIDRESEVTVSIKNISARALNFRADELMERFVRGDASRTTEGSGLGLSIAKTIVERENGDMKITLDGDLFKVEITLMK